MSANGISTLATKQARQEAKLDIAKAKREGKIVANDGSISGPKDPTQPWYRVGNKLHIDSLPTKYSGNVLIDNENPDGLVQGRPWTT